MEALNKFRKFFRALAAAYRGEGFESAGRVMQRIADGDVGGRGPDSGGRGRGDDTEMREALNEWNGQVFDALTGKLPPDATPQLGPVPEIIKALGGAGKQLVMSVSKLRKIKADHPEVTIEAISQLPQMLADPVFVLDNQGDQRSGDRLFVTDMVLGSDTVLVASIKRNGRDSQGGKATVVVTAYGKDQFAAMMNAADQQGDVIYVRGEREGSGYKHTGANSLNAPLSGTMSTLRASSKIRTPRAIFKSGNSPDKPAEMRRLLDAIKPKRIAQTFREVREAVNAFQRKDLVNAETGLAARVSRSTLDKMLSASSVGKSTSAELHSLAVTNIDDLFARAVKGWDKKDQRNEPSIVSMHRFFAEIEKPDGQMAMIKLTVKETAREGQPIPIYTIDAIDGKYASPATKWLMSAFQSETGPKISRPAEDTIEMAERVDAVNNAPVVAWKCGHLLARFVASSKALSGLPTGAMKIPLEVR